MTHLNLYRVVFHIRKNTYKKHFMIVTGRSIEAIRRNFYEITHMTNKYTSYNTNDIIVDDVVLLRKNPHLLIGGI